VHAAHPVLRAAWSFQSGPDACIATARAGAASLEIAVRPDSAIRLTLALPGDPPDRPVAHFSGPAGHWAMLGLRAGHHEAAFALGRNESALSRVLMLLSGGMLQVEAPGEALPTLSLPESGADGQQWFMCARRNVI
jgi:hypothetical protein